MNQKQLAENIKDKFGISYKIKGHNIYVKSDDDISISLQAHLEAINIDNKLGYKRFFIVNKQKNEKLIGSVPFGIAITTRNK